MPPTFASTSLSVNVVRFIAGLKLILNSRVVLVAIRQSGSEPSSGQGGVIRVIVGVIDSEDWA